MTENVGHVLSMILIPGKYWNLHLFILENGIIYDKRVPNGFRFKEYEKIGTKVISATSSTSSGEAAKRLGKKRTDKRLNYGIIYFAEGNQ